jgi:hypothetical protein
MESFKAPHEHEEGVSAQVNQQMMSAMVLQRPVELLKLINLSQVLKVVDLVIKDSLYPLLKEAATT